MYTNFESGRSMVEMLGVLAIMGILAITGIFAYNSAINRHRANELLHEATKRATVAAMQFSAGKEKASIAEFSGYSVFSEGTFDDDSEIKSENNRFKITLNNLSPEICQQMKNLIGTTATIRKIICSATKTGSAVLLFNSDLSTSDPQGQLCNASDEIYCSYNQICTTSGQTVGTCMDKADSWECLTNDDCSEPNTFCQISGKNCTLSSSKCVAIGTYQEPEIESLQKLRISSSAMSWWSARNWCQAQGMHLFNLDSYSIDTDIIQELKKTVDGWLWTAKDSGQCDAWTISTRFSKLEGSNYNGRGGTTNALCEG